MATIATTWMDAMEPALRKIYTEKFSKQAGQFPYSDLKKLFQMVSANEEKTHAKPTAPADPLQQAIDSEVSRLK